MKEYVRIRPATGREWWEADAKDSLARTVHEDYELIDTGVIGPDGEKIMARKRIDPIGFVRFGEK